MEMDNRGAIEGNPRSESREIQRYVNSKRGD
jgi:hypothetical protein